MPATNKGLASGGANVPVRQFFVNLGFVARTEFSAENPARTPSPEPLTAIFDKHNAYDELLQKNLIDYYNYWFL